ncbi:hypothetical protein JCM16303_001463 [Sporobolomyces ruberrimus]
MSGLDWQSSDFLSNSSGDDYLASLTSFLDGSSSTQQKYPQSTIDTTDLSMYGLGSLPLTAANHPQQPLNGQSPSSPELTSDSGASPSSCDNNIPVQSSRRSTGGSNSSAGLGSSSHEVKPLHDKRKGGPHATQAIKDRRSSNGKATATAHSHPDGVDGDITRSQSPEEEHEDGKKGGKKTSEKRKAQNRAAQRNFRERKEKHLKDLEDKVGALEQKANDSQAENSALKQLLQQLKSENDRLKVYESAFSFSYDKDVNNSSTMPTSSTFEPSTSSSRSSLPTTSTGGSPDSNDSPNTSFSFDNTSFELPVSHPGPTIDSSYTTSTSSSSYPSFPSLTSSLPPTTSTIDSSAGMFPDNLFLNSLTVPPTSSSLSPSPLSPPASSVSTTTRSSSSYITTPPTGTGPDLFASYRDPLTDLSLPSARLATFGDFDSFFNSSSTGSTSLELEEDAMNQFIKSPSPLLSPQNELVGGGEVEKKEDKEEKKKKNLVQFTGQPGCPYGLNVGEKYEFDLDNLCHEMKLKATCQEAARQALASAMAEDAQLTKTTYPAAQL